MLLSPGHVVSGALPAVIDLELADNVFALRLAVLTPVFHYSSLGEFDEFSVRARIFKRVLPNT